MVSSRHGGGIPILGKMPTEEVGIEVFQGFIKEGTLERWIVRGLTLGWLQGEIGHGQFEEPLDVGEEHLCFLEGRTVAGKKWPLTGWQRAIPDEDRRTSVDLLVSAQ